VRIAREERSVVLARRAERLARADVAEDRSVIAARIAVLSVGSQRVGIDVAALREILPLAKPTALPDMPGWMLGIVSVRGSLLAVADLHHVLGEPSGTSTVLAVVDTHEGTVGLAASAALEVRDVLADALSSDVSGERPIRAVTHDFVALLDLERWRASALQRGQ
jgi:purine-binding chemotaxis protein CheW